MTTFKALFSAAFLGLMASAATAQLTPEELEAMIGTRTDNLAGFQKLLDDPDPRRSLAAVEGMLASGDANIERLALEFGILSADPMIRATALEHHMSKLPALLISLDASKLPDEKYAAFEKVIKSLDGSIAPDKTASLSYQPAAYNDKYGCFPHQKASGSVDCLMRLGAGTVSVRLEGSYVGERWMNLTLAEDGTLVGGVSLSHNNVDAGSVPASMRLLD